MGPTFLRSKTLYSSVMLLKVINYRSLTLRSMPFSAASFFASGLAAIFPPVAGIGVGIETGVGIDVAAETSVVSVLVM